MLSEYKGGGGPQFYLKYTDFNFTPGHASRHHSLTADEGHGMTAILSIQVTSYVRNSRSV